MDLKCTLVKTGSKSIVFLVTPEEELRVLRALQERPEPSEVVVSAILSQNLEQSIIEQEILEVKRLFHDANALVVTQSALQSHQLAEVVCQAQLQGIRVLDLPSALLDLDPSVPANSADLIQMVAQAGIHQGFGLQLYMSLKNFMEPTLAAILLLVLSPLVLLVALAVKLTSPGPVFYRQTRLGYRRQLFDIIKFRSMRTDAEKNGPVWASASKSDARLTPIGGILRATHLDELPQIWNVVCGELSFIGPRPERPVFCQELEQTIPLFKLRTLIKPGITGWAQIRAGYANSVDDSKRKLEFDLYYILKHSPALDIKIIIDTLAILVTGGSEGRKRERVHSAGVGPRQRSVLPVLARRPGASGIEPVEAVNAEIS